MDVVDDEIRGIVARNWPHLLAKLPPGRRLTWHESHNHRWNQPHGIYKVAAKQTRLGEVEAADEREAVEKAAKEFKQHATKLIAVRRQ